MCEVLKTLSSPPDPKPFAINKQYKANMVPAESSETAVAEPPAKKRKCESQAKSQPKAAKSQPASSAAGAYVPHEYSEKRRDFIRKIRDDEGLSFDDAKKRWDESSIKKEILSGVSLSELIRRRFCPKGQKTNPWA